MGTTINKITKNLTILLYILCLIEIILFPKIENLYGCIVFILNMSITKIIIFSYKNFRTNYISSFILLSYTFCFSFMPLVATLINKVPLTYQFVVPYQTFNHHFIFQCSLIASFLIAKKIGIKKNIFRNILLYHTSYFKPVTPICTFIIGIIGLISLIFTNLINVGFISKIANGMTFLVAAPLMLLSNISNEKKYDSYVFIFIICTFIIGIASNSRSTMLFLILILFLVILTKRIINNEKFKISIKTFLILSILFFLIIGPIANLASAMVLIRHQRTEISYTELFNKTISLVGNKKVLYEMQKAYEENKLQYLEKNQDGWSEEYTGNIFLDRFCNLRVCDATIYYANKISYSNSIMWEKFVDNFISIFPSPLLKLLGLNSNVKETLEFSSGDLLYSLATNNKSALGGFKVSGYTGLGLCTFGYLFYPFAVVVFSMIFYLLDGLVLPLKDKTIIPLCTISLLYAFFYFLNNADGISKNINFILRGLPQSVFFYLLIIYILRLFMQKK